MENMMYFTLGLETTILFKSWKVETVAGLVASCVAVFVLAFMFEGMKALRAKLEEVMRLDTEADDSGTGKTEGTERTPILDGDRDSFHVFSLAHGVQTVCHVVQLTIAYALMLIVMTYNGWLTISVLLGAGLGYLFFGGRVSRGASVETRTKTK